MKTIICITLLAFCSCSALNQRLGLQDDNLGEEIFEAIIDMKTGIIIDLTPDSPEK